MFTPYLRPPEQIKITCYTLVLRAFFLPTPPLERHVTNTDQTLSLFPSLRVAGRRESMETRTKG